MLRDWRTDVVEDLIDKSERHMYSLYGATGNWMVVPQEMDEYEIETDILDDSEASGYESLIGWCSCCAEQELVQEYEGEDMCASCAATLEMANRRMIQPARNREKSMLDLIQQEAPVAVKGRKSPGTPASREEAVLYAIVRELFPNDHIEVNQFYEWLPAPVTLNPMQLDIFVPERGIAFEYDGPHHTQLTKGNSVNDLSRRYYRDRTKDALCAKRGVNLIRIDYREPLTRSYIESKLQKAVMK